MAIVTWTWQSPPVQGLHDLIEAFYSGLPHFSYSIVEQSRFKTVLSRGQPLSILAALVGGQYFYGDLYTVLTITHRPTADGLIDWSFRYDVELRQNADFKPVQDLTSEETDAFLEYYTQFGQVIDRFLPE